jgi:hypothetical protein
VASDLVSGMPFSTSVARFRSTKIMSRRGMRPAGRAVFLPAARGRSTSNHPALVTDDPLADWANLALADMLLLLREKCALYADNL